MRYNILNKPLVSVLMTAYNRSKYISEAIESVLNSSYENFELIIVDDCSSDNTFEIASQYVENESRVRVYKNEYNLGDYPNRNKAAEFANGKYIKYLDSDDIIYPYGLAIMVESMETFPTAGFGFSVRPFSGSPNPRLLTPYESYRYNYHSKEIFGRSPGSAIIKLDAFNKVGGFTGKRQIGDMEFWNIIARKYAVVTFSMDLMWDRIHGEQEQSYDDEDEKINMRDKVIREALSHEDCPLEVGDRKLALKIYEASLAKIVLYKLFRYGDLMGAIKLKNVLKLNYWSIILYTKEMFKKK